MAPTIARRAYCSALVACTLLAACVRLDPQEPAPDPQDPAPLEPPPVVEPTAPACERACAHRAALGCAPTYSACVPTCDAYEAEARDQRVPALGWSPECQATSASCPEADACRGSGKP